MLGELLSSLCVRHLLTFDILTFSSETTWPIGINLDVDSPFKIIFGSALSAIQDGRCYYE